MTDVTREPGEILDEIFEGDSSIYRLLLETSIDPVAIFDEQVTFVFVTPGYERLVGRGAEELIGTSGFDLVDPDDVGRLQRELAVLLESGSARVDGIRLRRPDESHVQIAAVARTFTGRDGKPLFVTFIHDLTPRQLVEPSLGLVGRWSLHVAPRHGTPPRAAPRRPAAR